MTDVTQLLKDIDTLSAEDKEKIASACGGAKVKPEVKDGVSTFTCGPNSQARISPFSGDGAKCEVSFPQWRFEVRRMLRDEIYPEKDIFRHRSVQYVAPRLIFYSTWLNRLPSRMSSIKWTRF